jgi:Rieske Fe-S protein
MKLSRRSFLSNSCKSCGAMMLAGTIASTLESCNTLAVYKTSLNNNEILVPVAEMLDIQRKIIRASNLEYDILLVKKTEALYTAMVLKCTHEDWLLSAGEKSINCTAHGSVFDFDGKVLVGPAINPLTILQTHINQTNIHIKINN